MDGIRQVSGPANAGRAPARTGGGSFTVGTGAPDAAQTAGKIVAAELSGLLVLQEDGAPERRRRDARRRCHDMLGALQDLQKSLLADPGTPVAIEHLASLTKDLPQSADPVLTELTRLLALRARVEIARRKVLDVKIARNLRHSST